MKLTLELTPDQIDQLAAAVAAKLGQRETPKTLTISQAAQQLGVHTDTIRRRVKAGTIPRVPCLGVVRIPASAFPSLNPSFPS